MSKVLVFRTAAGEVLMGGRHTAQEGVAVARRPALGADSLVGDLEVEDSRLVDVVGRESGLEEEVDSLAVEVRNHLAEEGIGPQVDLGGDSRLAGNSLEEADEEAVEDKANVPEVVGIAEEEAVRKAVDHKAADHSL